MSQFNGLVNSAQRASEKFRYVHTAHHRARYRIRSIRDCLNELRHFGTRAT